MKNIETLDWKTSLWEKLALSTVALTIIISIMDLIYAPIFANETVSAKAQVIGQDIVNLVLAAPLLLYSLRLAKKGSFKARTINIGILAYLAYTFLSYCVIFKLNQGFLLYTAAFGVSFYATIIGLTGINLQKIEISVSPGVKKRTPYALSIILLIIVLLWTPDIVNYYLNNQIPATLTLDNVHTLIIPFQDFSIVLPLTLITIWLLRKEEKLGYVLAPIVLVKALSIALAVIGMIVFMQIMGTPAVLGQIVVFLIGSVIIGWYTRYYYNGIEITESA